MSTALSEAKRFLFRYPWATSEIDNPVDLLADVVREVDEVERDQHKVKTQRLLDFVRRLRYERKISEAEYQAALRMAR